MESNWSWSYVLTLSDNAAVNWYNEIQMKLGTTCQYVMWRSGKILNFNNLPLSWSSRAGSSFLNYVQTVSSYIVEEQEMTWSVVPRITYAIWQVSHQVHKWYTVISFPKLIRLNKSFRVIDNWMVLSIFWPIWAFNLSLEWLFKKVTKLLT